MSGTGVIHADVRGHHQPDLQHLRLLLVENFFAFGEHAIELARGDVDVKIMQLFQQQRLREAVVILVQDVARHDRAIVTAGDDVGGQRR